jgi:glycosyltransferase involved in cell wall biosynthesis
MLEGNNNVNKEKPLISVIIPCYNGERYVLDCLSSVLKQDYCPIEIIAIDDASTDKTYDILSSFKTNRAVKVIRHEKNMGLAATYNDGLERSQGDFILLLHQDCQLGSIDWLSRALKHFADPKVAVVTGQTILNLKNMNFIQKAFTFLRKTIPPKDVSFTLEIIPFCEGKCDLWRKDVLLAIGGFPSYKLRISGEDQWVSYAVRQRGYKIVKDNSLTFKQEITEGLYSNLKKEFTFGKTQAGITLKYGLFQFSGVNNSPSMKSRVVNRLSKLTFALATFIFLVIGLILKISELIILSIFIFIFRILFLAVMSQCYVAKFTIIQSLLVSILGVMSDFIYFFGFVYGLLLSKRKL